MDKIKLKLWPNHDGKRLPAWNVCLRITGIETGNGQTGTLVLFDSPAFDRMFGVSLCAPDDEDNFRLGVKTAIYRLPLPNVWKREIWRALRKYWYECEQMSDFWRVLEALEAYVESLLSLS